MWLQLINEQWQLLQGHKNGEVEIPISIPPGANIVHEPLSQHRPEQAANERMIGLEVKVLCLPEEIKLKDCFHQSGSIAQFLFAYALAARKLS